MILRKLSIIVFVLSSCLILVSCSNSQETSSKLDKNTPTKEIVMEEESVVVFDDDFITRLSEYTSQFTCLDFSQSMMTYSLNDDERSDEHTVADVQMSLDLKNQIILTQMGVDLEGGTSNDYFFADDNKNDIHLSRVNDGDYISDDTLSSSISIDYSVTDNAYKFIEFITNGMLPEKGTKGEKEGGTFNFTLEREALESDVSGTDYDSLGTTALVLKVSEDNDGNLLIVGFEMQTTFFIGQKEYGVSTVCGFENYSNEALSLPDYVEVKE